MTVLTQIQASSEPVISHRWPAYTWLILGTLCILMASMRLNISLVAWFLPIPWLFYVSTQTGWRAIFALFFALLVAMHLSVLLIITLPVSFAMTPMFAIPNAVAMFLILMGWKMLSKNIGLHWSIYIFVVLMVVAEWLTANFSELGALGASANTQIENLPLLQSAAVFGIAGISFIMNWFAALVAVIMVSGRIKPFRWHIVALATVLVAVYSYGSIRLMYNQTGPQIRVVVVVTDLIFSGTFIGIS